jgi:hypothetical protein
MKLRAATLSVLFGSVLLGCATALPEQSQVDATSAARAAEAMMADVRSPQAEHYLSRAQDHMRAGEQALKNRDVRDAQLHFERAEIEAEAALALARADRAESEAKSAEALLEVPDDDEP